MNNLKFDDLPWKIQERLLWDMDLNFDHYESSQAECIHCISCGHVNEENKRIIADYWEKFEPETLRIYLAQEIDAAKRALTALQNLEIQLAFKENAK